MSSGLSRRAALRSMLHWWAGSAAGSLAGCALVGRSRTVPVARLADLEPGSAVRVTVRDEPVILVNQSGSVRALSGLCTHESCELGWNARQQLIRCPCHGSAFFPDGRVKAGPAQSPLPEFALEIRDGWIAVGKPKPTTGPPPVDFPASD